MNETTITMDMSDNNTYTQHKGNSRTFAEIASNVTLPKMNQAIVFNSINNFKQIEYVTAISQIVPAKNIQIFLRISNNRFCVFFNSQTIMENLLETHSSIRVNEIEIPIRRLINTSKRIILSSVYPNIPNQLILEALNEQGVKTTSSISHMKAGFSTEQFSHILSFRRQVYINQECASKIPSSITVTLENTTFRIFITDDTVTCFQCHQTGHFSSQCKNVPDQINIINNTENEMITLNSSPPSNTDQNTSPAPPTLHSKNTNSTHETDKYIENQTHINVDQSSNDPLNKTSLIDKLKESSNKIKNVTTTTQVKRPASSSTSQSPKSPSPQNTPSTMKPPDAPQPLTTLKRNEKKNPNYEPVPAQIIVFILK